MILYYSVAVVVIRHCTRERSELPQERSWRRIDMKRRAVSGNSMAVQPGFRAVPGWRSWNWWSSVVMAGVWIGFRRRWLWEGGSVGCCGRSSWRGIGFNRMEVSEDRYRVNWSVLVAAPRSPVAGGRVGWSSG